MSNRLQQHHRHRLKDIYPELVKNTQSDSLISLTYSSILLSQFVWWHVLSNTSRRLFISTFQTPLITGFPPAPRSLLVRRQLFPISLKISMIITIQRRWHDIKKFVQANKHNIICLSINTELKRQDILCYADVRRWLFGSWWFSRRWQECCFVFWLHGMISQKYRTC